MLEVLLEIEGVVLYLFEGFCMQYLFSAFAKARKGGTAGRYAAVPAWGIIRFFMSMMFVGNENGSLVFKLLCTMLLLFLFTIFWYKGSLRLKVFLTVQFIAVYELTFFAAYSFLYFGELLNKLFVRMFDEAFITVETFGIALNINMVISVLLMGVIQCGLLLYAVRKIVASYRYKDAMDKEVGYYLLPAVAGILVAVLLRLLMITVEDGSPVLLYGRYPVLYLVIPMIAIVLLGVILFSFQLYQGMIALQMERAEKAIMENQIVQMQNSLVEVEHLYDGIRGVRHDMKNHMAVLQNLFKKNLADSGAAGELRKYFEDMDAAVGQLDSRVHTGNAVCDAVISSKFLYAEKEIEGIILDADDFTLSDKAGMRAYDVGIILSNGLDNAIEACRKLREKQPNAKTYIEVRSFWNGKMYFIEIENSFDGSLRMDGESGYPVSTKTDGEAHGIGLRNIRNCAKKYAGDMDCIIKDGRFILSVMIKG